MRRKRVVLLLMLSIVLVVPLIPSTSFSTIVASTSQEEHRIEIEPDPLSLPNDCAAPAEINWNWASTTNLFNDPYGTVDNPSNLGTDDGSLCRLTEEYASSSYQLDLRFRTSSAVYAHQYLQHQLRMEFTQVWSLGPEDLRFYVCLASAQGNEGAYTYIGQLSSPGVYYFDIDQSILFDDSIKTARYLYIRVLGAIENSDGIGNSYDFDYLGIAYKSHVPYLTSIPSWDAVQDYLLSHYGINRNYAVFSATYLSYDGGSELSTFEYSYYDQIHTEGTSLNKMACCALNFSEFL
jgi:hypothetical protein